jgi:hypothetical protein
MSEIDQGVEVFRKARTLDYEELLLSQCDVPLKAVTQPVRTIFKFCGTSRFQERWHHSESSLVWAFSGTFQAGYV